MQDHQDRDRIAFQGRLGEDAFVRAEKLARRVLVPGGVRLGTLCLAAGVAFLILALLASGEGALSWFVLSLGAFAGAWLLRDRTRELWRKDPVLSKLQSGWIDEGGILAQTADQESRTSWDAFTGYARSGDLVVLFQGPLRYLPFPREMFAEDAAWEGFLALVDSRLYRLPETPQETISVLLRKPVWVTLLVVFLLSLAFALWYGLTQS